MSTEQTLLALKHAKSILDGLQAVTDPHATSEELEEAFWRQYTAAVGAIMDQREQEYRAHRELGILLEKRLGRSPIGQWFN